MEWFSQKTSIAGTQIFQLDTRSSGSRRDLDYLFRNVTAAASTYAVAHGAPAIR